MLSLYRAGALHTTVWPLSNAAESGWPQGGFNSRRLSAIAFALLLSTAPIYAHAQSFTTAERLRVEEIRRTYDKAAKESYERVKQWHRDKEAAEAQRKIQEQQVAKQEQSPAKPRMHYEVWPALSLFPDLPPNSSLPEQRRKQGIIAPVEYDKPFDGVIFLYHLTPEQMAQYCPKATGYMITLGCALLRPDGQTCDIKIAQDDVIRATGWTPEIVIRHELGHCNQWPRDHTRARVVP